MKCNYHIVNTIPQEIFRAYDIRGIVGETFNENNIYTIGLSIGTEILEAGFNSVVVGRDGRLSGPYLLKALIAGIINSGCNVLNIGEVTTPILYYTATMNKSRSGIMLSGSHNPPNYNGIKIILDGNPFYGELVQNLYKRIIAKNFRFGKGSEQHANIINHYIERILSDISLSKPLKVVIDCGNGVGGKVAPKLFRELGCEVTELYCNIDGNFPFHHPDPSVYENLNDLINIVKLQKADVGLAFDGDADRIGVVSNKGEIIPVDYLLIFFSIDFLNRYSKSIIPFDVKCTAQLSKQILKYGGTPLMFKTGHSLIRKKMKECQSVFAGEFSGHIFINERWYGFDDGIYVAARFLELLTKIGESCSNIFSKIPASISTPELKILTTEAKKFKLVKSFIQNVKFPNNCIINTIDGVRVDYDYGFGLIRASNTGPYLTMRFEGNNINDLNAIKCFFRKELLKIDSSLSLFW